MNVDDQMKEALAKEACKAAWAKEALAKARWEKAYGKAATHANGYLSIAQLACEEKYGFPPKQVPRCNPPKLAKAAEKVLLCKPPRFYCTRQGSIVL
jgi:hypothetical protein